MTTIIGKLTVSILLPVYIGLFLKYNSSNKQRAVTLITKCYYDYQVVIKW